MLYTWSTVSISGHIPGIGIDALAGVGVTTSLVILISSFSAIVGGGGRAIGSYGTGTGRSSACRKNFGEWFCLINTIHPVHFVHRIYLYGTDFAFTGASENTLEYAVDYLSIYLLGTVFVEISTGLNSFINAQGRPAIAMYSVLIGALLNIILDPIFIFWFDMGVKGLLWLPYCLKACSAAWVLSFLFSRRASLPLEKRNMRLRRKIVFAMLALGISPFIMASTESLVGFVLNSSLKNFGDIYVSALTILQSAMQFASVPFNRFCAGICSDYQL